MDYLEQICPDLGLAFPGERVPHHNIGTFRFIDTPEAVLYKVIALRREDANQILGREFLRIQKKYKDPSYTNEQRWEEEGRWYWHVRCYFPLRFREYEHVIRKGKFGDPNDRNQVFKNLLIAIASDFLANRPHFNLLPTFEGWKRYLEMLDQKFFHFLHEEHPVLIKESSRIAHTYLCGATNSGKSELLKLLIHSYIVNHPDTALVIMEPTGKLSTEVAKFRENFRDDRLIYVTYDTGRAPCINPLYVSGVSPSDTSTLALDKKAIVADELVGALGEMISEGGVQFTTHMETALRRCLLVLLDMKGATLRDLVYFMNDAQNDRLVEFALSRTHDPDGVSYFKTKFKAREPQIAQTKSSLYSRLDTITIGRALSALTCGENNIDLEREINAKKIIIFELSGRLGPNQGPQFGRLILAMIKSIAMRREELIRRGTQPVPVHVFIDEAHNFVSASIKKIMREARKYRVILTFTQTEIGAELPPATRDAVIGGANLKIAGRAGDPHPVARLLRVEDANVASLPKAEFILRDGEMPHALRFKPHSHLADNRHSMSEREWAKVWKRQLDTYYRPIPHIAPAEPPVYEEAEDDMAAPVSIANYDEFAAAVWQKPASAK